MRVSLARARKPMTASVRLTCGWFAYDGGRVCIQRMVMSLLCIRAVARQTSAPVTVVRSCQKIGRFYGKTRQAVFMLIVSPAHSR